MRSSGKDVISIEEIKRDDLSSKPILCKYGHITITEELVEKYLTKEHDRVIMKEFNNEKEIKSVGLTEFFS